MNIVMGWITAALIFIITTATFACLCENRIIKIHENVTQKIELSKINRFFIKIFLMCYIPLTIILVLFCVIDIFAFSKYPIQLLSSIIITTIAFMLERVIESTKLEMFSKQNESVITNKAVFAYIDLYCEIERINKDLIQQIGSSQRGIFDQFEQTQKNANYISEHIDGYVQWQTAECQKLLEEKNKLEQFFSDLGLMAEQLCIAFGKYEKKLDNSTKSLLYCEKGAMLFEDINVSIVSTYKQTSNEFVKQLEYTERQLRKVVDQYSHFKEYMGPYSEKVSVYGSRMESAIQSIQNAGISKQLVLENTGNEIKHSLEELNIRMGETLHNADKFLQKNIFIISRILETYRTNATSPRKLKRIIQSWQSLSYADVEDTRE